MAGDPSVHPANTTANTTNAMLFLISHLNRTKIGECANAQVAKRKQANRRFGLHCNCNAPITQIGNYSGIRQAAD